MNKKNWLYCKAIDDYEHVKVYIDDYEVLYIDKSDVI